MAGSSLLALIDDIATMLDDVSVMTKIAAKKTSGVLGDDLALNAEQVSGVDASRELPVVFAVAKGSLINKIILVPAALLLSAFLPQVIQPLLLIGGLFLCFEGFEKVYEKFFQKQSQSPSLQSENFNSSLTVTNHELEKPETNELSSDKKSEIEKEKIKGAIRTDFILSAEIIVISLGTVADQPISTQATVLSLIGFIMTVGVYGLVAGIVKLDDLGFWLIKKPKAFAKAIGKSLLVFAPRLMKSLGIIGTIAMFMVGGSLVVHSWSMLHHWIDALPFAPLKMFAEAGVGFIAGANVFALIHAIQVFKEKHD